VAEFRKHPAVQEHIGNPKFNDFFFARFLRARKGDVDKAVEMFLNRLKWREEVGADTILETFPKNPHYQRLVEYWPGSQHWKDPMHTQDGSVLLFEALGKCDPRMIDSIGIDTIEQFHIWCMENLERIWFETMAEKGFWPGFVMIEDLSGIGFHTFSTQVLKVVQTITYINQNYYPDMLRKAYIINVPSVFYMFWKGISLWLEPRTLAKLDMIGGGTEAIVENLKSFTDEDQLPRRLGGTNPRDIPEGGPVGDIAVKLRDKSKLGYVEVGRAGSYEKTVLFSEGDTASWEFKTKFYDIGFAIYYLGTNPTGTTKTEEFAMQRYDADKRVIGGTLPIKKSGYYQFFWDNTYSWTRGKSLKYNIYKGVDIVE